MTNQIRLKAKPIMVQTVATLVEVCRGRWGGYQGRFYRSIWVLATH